MFDWLRRRTKNQTTPEYFRAREMPSRGIPCGRSEQEAHEAFSARCDSIKRWLCESPRRPQVESPLFVEILTDISRSVLNHRAHERFALYAGLQQSFSRSRLRSNAFRLRPARYLPLFKSAGTPRDVPRSKRSWNRRIYIGSLSAVRSVLHDLRRVDDYD